ncbi:MAG TPA: hypothetical protein VJB68_00965, partial [Methylophilaceae bacterium]|nr:hypothetical protein [Methylophilaceae bacterium]
MANKAQLTRVAKFVAKDLSTSDLKGGALLERVAETIHSHHQAATGEGVASVRRGSWRRVSAAWKGRYRELARKALQRVRSL